MNRFNLEIKNPGPILKRFQELFTVEYRTAGQYLHLPAQHDYENPLNLERSKNILGMQQTILPEILHAFGIRSMSLDRQYDLSLLAQLSDKLFANSALKVADYLKSPELIAVLSELFAKARIIAFDDWTNISGASSIWQQLLNVILQPLGKTDFQFVFYLGDAAKMPSFEVDHALDIISAFADMGKVTLALDEGEALNLWRLLNGVGPQVPLGIQTVVELKKKYFSVYNIISVASLLVYSTDSALLFSSGEQFVLLRKNVEPKLEQGSNARENFILGYSTGLHGDMGMAESIALGLVVFGACGVYHTSPDQQGIQQYITEWIADLEKPESMNLYQ